MMKNFRVPFKPIKMDNYLHCYEFINHVNNKALFYDESVLKDIKYIISNKLKMEETKCNDLKQELRQIVLFEKGQFVELKLKPLISKAFAWVEPRFRILLWGCFNPAVSFEQYMNEYIPETILRDGKKEEINIPKHAGNIEIDRILSQWILCCDEDKKIKNYGYSSMKIIQSEGKSLHQFSIYLSI